MNPRAIVADTVCKDLPGRLVFFYHAAKSSFANDDYKK